MVKMDIQKYSETDLTKELHMTEYMLFKTKNKKVKKETLNMFSEYFESLKLELLRRKEVDAFKSMLDKELQRNINQIKPLLQRWNGPVSRPLIQELLSDLELEAKQRMEREEDLVITGYIGPSMMNLFEDRLDEIRKGFGLPKFTFPKIESLAFLKEGCLNEDLRPTLGSRFMDILNEGLSEERYKELFPYAGKKTWISNWLVHDYVTLLKKEYPEFDFVSPYYLDMWIRNYPRRVKGLSEFSKAEKIFFPIMYKSHWFLVVSHTTENEIYIIDSINHTEEYYEDMIKVVVWIVGKDCSTLCLVQHDSKQKDSNSCGVFMIKCMKSWAMGYQLKITNEIQVETLRISIIMEILNRKLEDQLMKPVSKLLILDLNGVLYSDDKLANHGFDFLMFCLSHFKVAFWSSKKLYNVVRTVGPLGNSLLDKLLFIWGQEHCYVSKTCVQDNPVKPVMFKDLKQVWEVHPSYNRSNTLLVDDSPYKGFINDGKNCIFPTLDSKREFLRTDGDFAKYLKRLASAYDVQDFIEKERFGENPITKESDNGKFYSGALQTIKCDGYPELSPEHLVKFKAPEHIIQPREIIEQIYPKRKHNYRI